MEPQRAAFAFLGMIYLLKCMEVRMASTFSMYGSYSLHNLNTQLALLDYERQVRQRRRRQPNPYRW